MKISDKLDQWFYLEGDTPEELEVKRIFFLFTVGVVPPVIGLTVLTYILDVPVLKVFGWLLLAYYFVAIVSFAVVRKHTILFYYFNSIIVMCLTFYTMAKQGGLLHSGGIEFSSLAIVIFAFIFSDKKLALINTATYMGGIIYIAAFHSSGEIAPEMKVGNVNLIFTTLNSLWISIYILMVIVYVFNRRTKDEKIKLAKLKELDDAKSRLFTNITHEFRTPISVILGIADNIQTDANNHVLKNNLHILENNARRLLRLVNQMLELSKAESGLLDIQYVQSDVMSYLSYLILSIKSLAEKKQINLHFIKNQESLWMDLDLQKIEEIVINLIHNSIKFTPNGGNIYLIATYIEDKKILQIEVKDTGIGILKEKLPLIFERFFQISSENQPITEGSGIGITLVKEYVQSLNGTISVDSMPEQGTTFTIQLPVNTTNKKVNWMDHLYKDDGSNPIYTENNNGILVNDDSTLLSEKPLVLIVEDNVELTQLLQILLSREFATETACDGEEGVIKAIECVPDLIVSDIMMPKKDGYELCATLKNDFRTNHIPIVLLTAMADGESKILGYQKGADAYIYKPFKGKELIIRLKKLYESREKLKLKYSQKNLSSPESRGDSRQLGLNERFLVDVYAQLELHYQNENFGIPELCSALGISRVQLHRKLTALTGISTSHFINKFRLEKACSTLLSSRKSIAEVSYEVGFSDPGYFSRLFHKIYGKTPLEYRTLQQ